MGTTLRDLQTKAPYPDNLRADVMAIVNGSGNQRVITDI